MNAYLFEIEAVGVGRATGGEHHLIDIAQMGAAIFKKYGIGTVAIFFNTLELTGQLKFDALVHELLFNMGTQTQIKACA